MLSVSEYDYVRTRWWERVGHFSMIEGVVVYKELKTTDLTHELKHLKMEIECPRCLQWRGVLIRYDLTRRHPA